jgi:hypothetical protein
MSAEMTADVKQGTVQCRRTGNATAVHPPAMLLSKFKFKVQSSKFKVSYEVGKVLVDD